MKFFIEIWKFITGDKSRIAIRFIACLSIGISLLRVIGFPIQNDIFNTTINIVTELTFIPILFFSFIITTIFFHVFIGIPIRLIIKKDIYDYNIMKPIEIVIIIIITVFIMLLFQEKIIFMISLLGSSIFFICDNILFAVNEDESHSQ